MPIGRRNTRPGRDRRSRRSGTSTEGVIFAVPPRAENQVLQVHWVRRIDGEPDVRHHARAAHVEQRCRLAGFHGHRVVVAARAVPARRPARLVVAQAGLRKQLLRRRDSGAAGASGARSPLGEAAACVALRPSMETPAAEAIVASSFRRPGRLSLVSIGFIRESLRAGEW